MRLNDANFKFDMPSFKGRVFYYVNKFDVENQWEKGAIEVPPQAEAPYADDTIDEKPGWILKLGSAVGTHERTKIFGVSFRNSRGLP